MTMNWWETWVTGAAVVGTIAALVASWMLWTFLTEPVALARLLPNGF